MNPIRIESKGRDRMSILPSSTSVPPAARDAKHLRVKLVKSGTETFQAITGWEGYSIDSSALTVIRPDGTRKIYATGVWETVETELA